MLKIGLTGGIGSGKSTVATLFSAKGVSIIDADKISHSLVTAGSLPLMEIVKHFSTNVLNVNGSLNRAALREHIFNHPEEKIWLENLLHPLIRAKMSEQLLTIDFPYCIIDIPLLVEKQAFDLIDRTLVVDTTIALQLARSTSRDKQSCDEIEKIIATQASREERLAVANDIIHNESSIADLQQQVDQLHHTYLKLAEGS